MMTESFILNSKNLEKVKDSTLFYPCSGNDLLVPIELFSPYVTDFLFVDRGYFSPGHQDTLRYGFDAPANEQEPLLNMDPRYVLTKTTINGPPSWNSENGDIDPCILTEIYRHKESHREVRIRRRRGYGFSAFRNEIKQLGVFFYRGDSSGEGGSGNLWLNKEHIDKVCNKLIDGGLIVSDGSDGSMWKRGARSVYKELWKYSRTHTSLPPKEKLVESMESFEDHKGRRFCCVGYAGMRYGPTMVWQLNKNAQQGAPAERFAPVAELSR